MNAPNVPQIIENIIVPSGMPQHFSLGEMSQHVATQELQHPSSGSYSIQAM